MSYSQFLELCLSSAVLRSLPTSSPHCSITCNPLSVLSTTWSGISQDSLLTSQYKASSWASPSLTSLQYLTLHHTTVTCFWSTTLPQRHLICAQRLDSGHWTSIHSHDPGICLLFLQIYSTEQVLSHTHDNMISARWSRITKSPIPGLTSSFGTLTAFSLTIKLYPLLFTKTRRAPPLSPPCTQLNFNLVASFLFSFDHPSSLLKSFPATSI